MGQASAATCTWTNTSTDGLASTMTNWENATVGDGSPCTTLTGNFLQFIGSRSNDDVVFDTDTTTLGMLLNSSYTGTVRVSSTLTTVADVSMNGGGISVSSTGALVDGGALNVSSTGGAFVLDGGTLTVTGAATVTTTATFLSGIANFSSSGAVLTLRTGSTFNAGASTLNFAAGIVVIDSGATFNAGGSTIDTGRTGSNAITNSGTFNANTSTVIFSGAGLSVDIPALTYYNLTLSDTSGGNLKTGTTTINGVLTVDASCLLSTADSNVVLDLAGTSTPFILNGTFDAVTTTVVYDGATANIASTTYYNLTLSNSVSASITGSTTVSNVLSITSGILQETGSENLTLTATGTPFSNLSAAHMSTTTDQVNVQFTGSEVYIPVATYNSLYISSASSTLLGDVTTTAYLSIGSGDVLNVGNNNMFVSLVINAGTINQTSGTVYMTHANGYISSGTANLYNLTISGASNDLNASTVIVSNVLTIGSSKTLTLSSAANLTLSATGTPFVLGSGAVLSAGASTITYSGAGSTNVAAGTYYNLVVSSTGAILTGSTTVSSVLTINSSKTLNASTAQLTLAGGSTPLVNSGTFTTASSTVRYTNAVSANVTGATYWDLALGSGSYTLVANATSSDSLTNAGTFSLGNFDMAVTGDTFTNSGTTTLSGTGLMLKASSGGLDATSYTSGSGNGTGNTITIAITDSATNLLGASIEQVTTTVSASGYSDSEVVTLTETGVATGIFSGTVPFNIASVASSNNKVDVSGSGTVTLSYTNDYGALAGASTTATYSGSNYTAPASGGGGYAAPQPPTVSSAAAAVSVSAVMGDSNIVTLTLSATNATQMAISEDPNFASASWESYSSTKQLTLSSGNGQKTIYVKFRSVSGGETAVYKVMVNSAGKPIPAEAVNNTPAPVVANPNSVVSAFAVANSDSKVVISPVKKLVYTPNSSVSYTYSFKNETGKTLKIKVLRQVVDANGKVVAKVTGSATIAKGKTFKSNATSALSSKLADNVYTVQVKVMDSKNIVLDENSFEVTVQKPLPPPSISTNNPDSKVAITGLKVDYKPGSVVKYVYSYKNESGKPLKVKIIRQVLDASGKAVVQVDGTRTLSKGQNFKFNATSSLSKKLADGVYTAKVQVLDSKNVVLGENSFDFTVSK